MRKCLDTLSIMNGMIILFILSYLLSRVLNLRLSTWKNLCKSLQRWHIVYFLFFSNVIRILSSQVRILYCAMFVILVLSHVFFLQSYIMISGIVYEMIAFLLFIVVLVIQNQLCPMLDNYSIQYNMQSLFTLCNTYFFEPIFYACNIVLLFASHIIQP